MLPWYYVDKDNMQQPPYSFPLVDPYLQFKKHFVEGGVGQTLFNYKYKLRLIQH